MPDKKFRGISNLPVAIPDVPDAPTVSATNVGTSRAYNNGAATVTIASPTGGLPSSYSITTTPITTTTTATSSPVTLTGLTSATSYTVTATATNVSATGPATTSSSFTATTIPNAPTIGTFTDGGTGTTGTLSFTAPATGGSAITNYSYSTDSSTYTTLSPAQTTSPLSLTGLTVGTYSFSVKAINANGTSAASSTVSGTVITPTAFESIASATGTGASGTITFSSIPATYVALQIRGIVRCDSAFVAQGKIQITANGDSSALYAWHALEKTVTTNGINQTYIQAAESGFPFAGHQTDYFGSIILDINNYASTTQNKTFRMFNGFVIPSDAAYVSISSGLYRSTSALTSITLTSSSGNWTNKTQFALYGIKG